MDDSDRNLLREMQNEGWHDHEVDHQVEREGGPKVDRRHCQGIGCPYGDH